ncbi:hypothetical protein GGI26_004065 [Coemansia sp. RSA 1358]|nr:hypothetical protein GGI26_004065 [Coemansia sp. RSA 1358]
MDTHQTTERSTKKPRLDNNTSETKQAILASFAQYRNSLDRHYDQRERVIKCSRDITAQSKKIVFALLRITQDGRERAFAEAHAHHTKVLAMLQKVSVELQGSDAFKYNRQVSPGIQEYIEAVALWGFLDDGRLITKEEAQRGLAVEVTDEDYVLGICDLPGEVNRYCINAIGKGDHDAVKQCVGFLRVLKEGVGLLGQGRIRDLDKKLGVLESSLGKAEAAYYSMAIRHSEMSSAAAGSENKPSLCHHLEA